MDHDALEPDSETLLGIVDAVFKSGDPEILSFVMDKKAFDSTIQE